MLLKSIGLMSGTSMDGIDAALIETDGQNIIRYISNYSLSYQADFKKELRSAELLVRQAKKNIAPKDIIIQSTKLHAQAVEGLLNQAHLKSHNVDLIGYHGQSLYHNPQEKITIQIGDGQLLANLTGIKVINEFRKNDIDNGGQGAPLAPLYHHIIAKKLELFPLAVVNCGGIANITIINGPNEEDISGFDTGPGNVLLDRYIREKTSNQEFMDFNGKYSLQGEVNDVALDKLLIGIKSYLARPFPKSLDPGELNLIDELYELNIQDACATLAAFTAICIVNSCESIPKNWILAGGGWNNPAILGYLKKFLNEKRADVIIKTANQVGFNSSYMEAELFAYLAVRSYHNLPISFPKITGCKFPTLGGNLFIPAGVCLKS